MFCVPIGIFCELRLCFLAVNLVLDLLADFEIPATMQASIGNPLEKTKATGPGGMRGQRATLNLCTVSIPVCQGKESAIKRADSFAPGVGLAAGFVRAAGGGAIGVVNQDVVMASGAEHAVDGLTELVMLGVECVICLCFRTGHSHLSSPPYGFHFCRQLKQ